MDSQAKEKRKQIGNNIKKIREAAGLTQAQVATKAKINVNYFAVIERGGVMTNPMYLNNIADALKVDVSEIMNPK